MRSLERRFNNISRRNPLCSSYICFTKAIEKQNFSPRTIKHYFNKLVEKDNYAPDEKGEILKHLYIRSPGP